MGWVRIEGKRISLANLGFIMIFLLLLVLIILDVLQTPARFVFVQTNLGQSLYATLSGIIILFYFIIWGAFRIGRTSGGKIAPKELVLKGARFVGLGRPSLNLSYSVCGLFVGVSANLIILSVLSILGYGRIGVNTLTDVTTIIQNFLVAPLFEELIFRGIYLSVFLDIFGKSRISAVSGIIFSSITFGWIHPTMPILKTIGGLILGAVFLLKFRKDLLSSTLAHFGVNLIGTFLVFY